MNPLQNALEIVKIAELIFSLLAGIAILLMLFHSVMSGARPDTDLTIGKIIIVSIMIGLLELTKMEISNAITSNSIEIDNLYIGLVIIGLVISLIGMALITKIKSNRDFNQVEGKLKDEKRFIKVGPITIY